MTLSKIIRASAMLSDTAAATFGDGRMSSRASRTAAMMAAAITNVDAKRSVCRCCSSQASRRRKSLMTASIGEQEAKYFNRRNSIGSASGAAVGVDRARERNPVEPSAVVISLPVSITPPGFAASKVVRFSRSSGLAGAQEISVGMRQQIIYKGSGITSDAGSVPELPGCAANR
jgi:hypothetical protein